MKKEFKIPPKSRSELTSLENLTERLECIVGTDFQITGKSRTDGSNVRRLVASILENYDLPVAAESGSFEFIPPRRKGVPKITREFVDTYIVTSGTSYNLQVWNRVPASKAPLIKLGNEEILRCSDVRFIFVRINIYESIVDSVILLTPNYIEEMFGKFGRPTIKYQLLISSKIRNEICSSDDKILFFPDSNKLSYLLKDDFDQPNKDMVNDPTEKEIFSLHTIKDKVASKLIGEKIPSGNTKNRGQALEKRVLELLGYSIEENKTLYGAYPDIRNQLLEVKIQDSPTVDLGKYSPEIEEVIFEEWNITTFDVRYLIALTNPHTEIVEGVILSPGEKLGEVFSYVKRKSFKCQRSIPMSFFEKYSGKAVFNPTYK